VASIVPDVQCIQKDSVIVTVLWGLICQKDKKIGRCYFPSIGMEKHGKLRLFSVPD